MNGSDCLRLLRKHRITDAKAEIPLRQAYHYEQKEVQ